MNTFSQKIYPTLLILLFSLFYFSQNAFAATVTWNGGNGDWIDDNNWDTGEVPTAGDDVFIFSGIVSIPSFKDAEGQSLFVGTTASLTINSDASLTILGAKNASGITNKGTITSFGDILVADVSGSSHIGILSSGLFVNDGGTLIVYNIWNSKGIQTTSGSSFENKGEIILHDILVHCIYNEGDFVNHGDITISDTNQDGLFNLGSGVFSNTGNISITPKFNALQNGGKFINEPGGFITIEGNQSNGFSGILNYSGTLQFLNRGIIVIYNYSKNIYISNGELVNEAKIYSYDAIDKGIIVKEDGTLRNKAELWVQDGLNDGIHVSGFLVNNKYGSIYSLNHNNDGIEVDNGAELRNFGRININDNGDNGILNFGLTANKRKGKIFISDPTVCESGGTLINAGHFFNTFTGINQNNGGTITNTGGIEDAAESFNGIFNNQKFRVVPLSGNVQVGQPVQNALDLGSLNGITVGNWTNIITGDIVGSYNANNNTFTPNANAVGLTEILVPFTINAIGNQAFYRVPIPSGVQSFTGGGGSSAMQTNGNSIFEIAMLKNNTPTLKSNFNIYPNPARDILFIETVVSPESVMELVLFNSLGQEVFQETISSGNPKTSVGIPSSLPNGNYLLASWQNGKMILSEKIMLMR